MTVSLNGADQRGGAGDLAEEGFVNDALARPAGKALGKAKELTPRFLDGRRIPTIRLVQLGDVSVVECAGDR